MTQPRVIDWFRVIVDLGRAGMSYRALAESVGVSKSAVMGWVGGAEPKHADGERLLAVWCDRTGKPADDAPRAEVGDWRLVRSARAR